MTAEEQLSTRDTILRAALVMFADNPASRLSVRTVAERAGVSTGSLRHHFPTQRALREAVLTTVYDLAVPDEQIRDRSVPPRERLLGCLRQVLSGTGVGDGARAVWRTVLESFVLPEPTEDLRAASLAMEQEGRLRMERWLGVLAEEGAVARDDIPRQARFLGIVLDGLALARAMPADDTLLPAEADTLDLAVDAVLLPGARGGTTGG